MLFPGALGDFICFLPALCALARTASVDLFARSEFIDLVPGKLSVHALERYEINQLFVSEGDAESIRSFFAPYAAIYSWMGSSNGAFARQLRQFSRGRAHIFPFESDGSKRHQSEYYLSCVDCRDSPVARISLKPHAIGWSAAYWARYSLEQRKVLVVAPGSGAREKNWPISSFAAVGEWWHTRIGGESLVVLGPVEEERGGIEPVLRWSRALRSLSLAELAAVIARADLYLGNDSGITHLAAALGVPTLALFGPSDAQRWAPHGQRVRILSRPLECAPCVGAVMKACQHRSCLHLIEPAEVIEELGAMLDPGRLDKVGGRD